MSQLISQSELSGTDDIHLPDDLLAEAVNFDIAEDIFQVVLVDTVEKVSKAVERLLEHKQLAVDLEGVDLSRKGAISLIQIAPADEKIVFLFDITTLKERAFYSGLFQLLTEKSIVKVFFDVRGDCDALFHQYNFVPGPIVDCQVALMSAPRRRDHQYVVGLKKAFAFAKSLSDQKKELLESVKQAGLSHFAPEHGGRKDVWEQRPLNRELLVYAAVDVWYLNIVFQEYLKESRLSLEDLEQITKGRIIRVISSEKEMKGPHMAERDF